MGNEELLKPNPIEIRAALPGDEINMGLLYEQDGLPDDQLIFIVQASEKDFTQIETGDRSIWFAFESDTPVGVVQLLSRPRQRGLESDSATAELHHLKVVTKYQGKGIGSRLNQAAEQEAMKKGYNRIVLDVDVNNAYAIDIYHHWGYSVASENTSEDYVSYTMVKNLS